MTSRELTFAKKEIKNEVAKAMPNIFKNRGEADWALDLLSMAISRLGIEDPNDMRLSIFFRPNVPYISFSFDKRTFLGFDNSDYYKSCRLELLLQANLKGIDEAYIYRNIDKYDYEPDIRVYKMPIEMLMPFEGDIRKNYETSLDYIRSKKDKPEILRKPDTKKGREKLGKLALNDIFLRLISDLKEREELFQGLKGDSKKLHPKEYSLEECSEDTKFDFDTLERWVRAIKRKGQAIIYGPPGTGKTYISEHLADHLIGGGDGFKETVQFHPQYAYEDFIQGIRPQSGDNGTLNYPMVPGRFLEFCKKAKYRQGYCVLIIDEINRANLSQVFGELMYLLEYRTREIPLSGGETLQIPINVLIIGTMNTADRSVALVDHALRRRFAFLRLQPDYEILRRYHQNTDFPVDALIKVLRELNAQINDTHYELGIAFFLREDLAEEIEDIWKMEVEPYLDEYFFDRPEKTEDFRWEKVRGKMH